MELKNNLQDCEDELDDAYADMDKLEEIIKTLKAKMKQTNEQL